jgi:hypothetical protein
MIARMAKGSLQQQIHTPLVTARFHMLLLLAGSSVRMSHRKSPRSTLKLIHA